jgi:aminoglycoside N3'-acetyltransferase
MLQRYFKLRKHLGISFSCLVWLHNSHVSSGNLQIPPKEELVSVLEKVKGFIGESVSGIKETFNFADQGQSDTTKD